MPEPTATPEPITPAEQAILDSLQREQGGRAPTPTPTPRPGEGASEYDLTTFVLAGLMSRDQYVTELMARGRDRTTAEGEVSANLARATTTQKKAAASLKAEADAAVATGQRTVAPGSTEALGQVMAGGPEVPGGLAASQAAVPPATFETQGPPPVERAGGATAAAAPAPYRPAGRIFLWNDSYWAEETTPQGGRQFRRLTPVRDDAGQIVGYRPPAATDTILGSLPLSLSQTEQRFMGALGRGAFRLEEGFIPSVAGAGWEPQPTQPTMQAGTVGGVPTTAEGRPIFGGVAITPEMLMGQSGQGAALGLDVAGILQAHGIPSTGGFNDSLIALQLVEARNRMEAQGLTPTLQGVIGAAEAAMGQAAPVERPSGISVRGGGYSPWFGVETSYPTGGRQLGPLGQSQLDRYMAARQRAQAPPDLDIFGEPIESLARGGQFLVGERGPEMVTVQPMPTGSTLGSREIAAGQLPPLLRDMARSLGRSRRRIAVPMGV